MSFDITTWKNELKSRLPGWQARMKAAGANSAYYFIAASAFLPIAQAMQGGNIEPFAFTAVASGLGANLLANIVQHWRDEANAAVELQQAVKRDPELQPKLDALLEQLDALQAAERALGDTDKAWFVETIQRELGQLKSGIHYQATLIGSGAISQGGGDAVGAGGMLIKGNVTGGVNQRNIHTQSYSENHFAASDPRALEKEKSGIARQKYLQKLRRHCQTLPLAALGGEEAEDEISLDTVYIDLDTQLNIRPKDLEAIQKGHKINLSDSALSKENPELNQALAQRDEKMVPLPLLNAVLLTPRVVLLGDPGAGKSTFARKLLGLQSAVLLGQYPALNNLASDLLPVLVVLRELVLKMDIPGFEKLPGDVKKEKLLAAFRIYLTEELQRMDAGDFLPAFFEAFEAGKILLVLDGLDEVPQDMRQRVRAGVTTLLAEYHLERLIITSRIRSYSGEAVFPNLQTFTLRPFSEEKIRNFVQAWYKARVEMGLLSEKDRPARVEDLVKATNGDLSELAGNPMMLTSMAIIHQKEIGLPRERVRLYRLVVDVLLRRWQKHKLGEDQMTPSAGLLEFLKDERRLLDALERLAYEAHSAGRNKKEAADLSRKEALAILEQKEFLKNTGLASEFLDYVDQRAGLLKGNGGDLDKPTSYSFPHRTFQEYLAGAYMVRGRSAAREYTRLAAEGDHWALAAQLGAEELLHNRLGQHAMLDLAYDLCTDASPQTVLQQRLALWSGGMALAAGKATVEADNEKASGGAHYLKRLVSALLTAMQGELPPLERAEAGRVLAKLGDPRPEVLTCEHMFFCHIPAGEFLFGDAKKKIKIANEYWIGKYPVTNAQFAHFLVANGYKNPAYWLEAIKKSYWSKAGFKANWDDKPRTAPVDYGEPYNLPNHPVVGISWYEALAFTCWVSEQCSVISGQWSVNGGERVFREQIKAEKLQAALPSEEQWEKAARGPLIGSGDGQEYPWPGEFDPNKANTHETGIGTTTTVGAFPAGESPYGLLDASGNVWEWTTSPYSQSSYTLRGGSFGYPSDHARCAFRGWYDPYSRLRRHGFRIVLVSHV
jgi:formylglycine-generating enzyme required for sulfatase activity